MSDFAKLFKTQEHGQILAVLDNDQDDFVPVITIMFMYEEATVSVNLKFSDTDLGYELRENAFNNLSELSASEMVDGIKKQLSGEGGFQ